MRRARERRVDVDRDVAAIGAGEPRRVRAATARARCRRPSCRHPPRGRRPRGAATGCGTRSSAAARSRDRARARTPGRAAPGARRVATITSSASNRSSPGRHDVAVTLAPHAVHADPGPHGERRTGRRTPRGSRPARPSWASRTSFDGNRQPGQADVARRREQPQRVVALTPRVADPVVRVEDHERPPASSAGTRRPQRPAWPAPITIVSNRSTSMSRTSLFGMGRRYGGWPGRLIAGTHQPAAGATW